MASVIPTMQDLLEAGVHFGHRVRRGNPKMSQFIYGARDGVHIIDLAKSEEKLHEAIAFAKKLGEEGKNLLVIGTKKQAKPVIERLAKDTGIPFLTERWIGGTLTNFDEIRRNVKKMLDLKAEKEKGELSRFTKKEQLLISRKLEKFEKELGGISDLAKIPEAVFVIDAAADLTAIKEANRMGVTIVAFADTNSDPTLIDYPIPANDDGIKSITIVCEAILNSYSQAKKQAIGEADKKTEEVVKEVKKDSTAKKEDEIEEGVTPEVEEIAALEEEVEKKALEESERKV